MKTIVAPLATFVVGFVAGCSDDSSNGFEFEEGASVPSVTERLERGVQFRSGCLAGVATVPVQRGERTRLRLSNECGRAVELHFVLGVYSVTSIGYQPNTFFYKLDVDGTDGFDSRTGGISDGVNNTLPLIEYGFSDGSALIPKMQGVVRTQIQPTQPSSWYHPYWVTITLDKDSETEILGDTVGPVLEMTGTDDVERLTVLIPMQTEVDADIEFEEVPWPFQHAIDSGEEIQHVWSKTPNASDPRPRQFHVIELDKDTDE